MNESNAVILALAYKTLLVGGIVLALPWIGRKGLLFGVYVGEVAADETPAKRLRTRWARGFGATIGVALGAGLLLVRQGYPNVGNLTATVVLLSAGGALYLRCHRAARRLVPRDRPTVPAARSVASLAVDPPGRLLWPAVALALCLLLPLAVRLHLERVADAAPASALPAARAFTLFGFLVPSFVAFMALLTVRAKRSLRGGSGGGSEAAQTAFRAATASLLATSAVVFSIFFAALALVVVHPQAAGAAPWIPLLSGLVIAFAVLATWRLVHRFGQGGSRLETPSADTPLTNGLADDARWKLGLFYVDRDDPSLLVEKRFGLGYTLNFGNPKAVLLVVGFLVLLFGAFALGFGGASG